MRKYARMCSFRYEPLIDQDSETFMAGGVLMYLVRCLDLALHMSSKGRFAPEAARVGLEVTDVIKLTRSREAAWFSLSLTVGVPAISKVPMFWSRPH